METFHSTVDRKRSCLQLLLSLDEHSTDGFLDQEKSQLVTRPLNKSGSF